MRIIAETKYTYVARDGKKFDNENDCETYEKDIKKLVIKTTDEELTRILFGDKADFTIRWDSARWNKRIETFVANLEDEVTGKQEDSASYLVLDELGYIKNLLSALRIDVDEDNNAEFNRWILVEESLPIDDMDRYITFTNGEIAIGYYSPLSERWVISDESDWEISDIVAWYSFVPEPYNGDMNE